MIQRPQLVEEMLGYAPIPLREYVEELESQLHELAERDRQREDPQGQQKIIEAGDNSLGGFARDSETSRRAALDNYPRSGTQRHKVLQAVIDAGDQGATSEEIALTLKMHLPSVKPRLTELREGGFVAKADTRTGAMGSGVDVYTATPKGRSQSRHRDPDEMERDDVTTA